MTSIPAITGAQMAQVDQAMLALGVDTLQLMELAGYAVAAAADRWFDSDADHAILALAGTGGNGGDAMVAARLLAARGYAVTVVLTHPTDHYRDVPAHQLASLHAMGIPVLDANLSDPLPQPDLIIDGLLGFSLAGNPRGTAADLIAWANSSAAPILAIDLPSGLDATTGQIGDPCIHAAQTITLALPKTGLIGTEAVTGSVIIGDIGVPPTIYQQFGVQVPCDLFRGGQLTMWTDGDSHNS